MEIVFAEFLENKNVLVTGSCGFIGPNLILELQKHGANVSALDLPSADWRKLPEGVKCIKADVLNKNELVNVFNEFEIIYHLAAKTDLDGKNLEDYRANFEGPKNVIEEAAQSRTLKRFVFYSTQLVVGLFNEKRFINESEPYRTKTIYGESKIEGEKAVADYCRRHQIPFTIIRPTSVYGPWGETPYKQFFQTVKHRRYFHVGKADNLVSWVYVKNLVDHTILASVHPKAENVILFGNDLFPYTMREIVNEIAEYYKLKIGTIPIGLITIVAYALGILKAIGIKVPIYPFRLRNMRMNYCCNMQKSIELGYCPRYSLREGIKETLDWYEERKLI